MEDLKHKFIQKAGEYFDKCVEDNEIAANNLAMEMAIIRRQARALYIAERKQK